MITKNEIEAIEYVLKFGVVTTSFMSEVVWKDASYRYCASRLQMLCEEYKELKRERQSISSQYVYYKDKKPKQLLHKLMLSEFYKHLNKYVDIKIFETEYRMEGIRADAYVGFKGIKNHIGLVEIDISKNSIKEKIEKYEHFSKAETWKTYNWPRMPELIIVGNRKVPKSTELKIIQIDTDFSNMEEHFTKR